MHQATLQATPIRSLSATDLLEAQTASRTLQRGWHVESFSTDDGCAYLTISFQGLRGAILQGVPGGVVVIDMATYQETFTPSVRNAVLHVLLTC